MESKALAESPTSVADVEVRFENGRQIAKAALWILACFFLDFHAISP